MTSLESMHKQLEQVFEYAEMLVRLNSVQELLNPVGGYAGEREIDQKINELKVEIRNNIETHLKNSNVSERARTIVNNWMVLRRNDNGDLSKPPKIDSGNRFA